MEKPEVPDTNPLEDFARANGFGALRDFITTTGTVFQRLTLVTSAPDSAAVNFAIVILLPLII